MKNFGIGFIVGVVLVGVLLLVMGARETNLEKEIYEKVAERWGRLVLVGDKNGDYIVVNKETAKARRVEYEDINRANQTVPFGPSPSTLENFMFVVPKDR